MFKQLLMHKKFILCTVLFLASSQFNQGAVTSIPGNLYSTVQLQYFRYIMQYSLVTSIPGTLSSTVQFPGTHHRIVHSLVFQVHCTVQFSHQYSRHTLQHSSVTSITGTLYSTVQSLVFQAHSTVQFSHQNSQYIVQYLVQSLVLQVHFQYSSVTSIQGTLFSIQFSH